MARTITEIQEEIINAKNSEPTLSGLNSNSQTAIWKLWVYIVSVAHRSLELLWDIYKNEITSVVNSRRLGTPDWYVTISKDFQLGDDLQENGTYAVIDPSKKIITRASFKENELESVLIIKVAKGSETAPTALSQIELNQFRAYINKLRFAGTRISIVSLNADILKGSIKVFYDGIFPETQITSNVKDAITQYLFELPFDGVFVTNEMIERIRSVDGVFDVEITALRGAQGENETPIGRLYESQAGYIQLDNNFSIINIIQP